jgi:regulatory protein
VTAPDDSQWRPEPPAAEWELSAEHQELAQTAREVALRRLSHSPQTRAQLVTALAGKEIPEDIAVAVLDRFEEVGLIDDQAYVEMFLDSCRVTPGRSRRWISHRLVSKGVDRDLAQEAVQQISDDEELASAVALLRRKGRGDPADRKEVNRRYALLARRGFSPSTISTALGVAGQEPDDSDGIAEWDTVASP